MDFKIIMESMEKENSEIPKPMKLMGELDESLMVNHITNKNYVMSNEAIPDKYKALILLSSAIALDSSTCILNNTKLARKNGASVEEIMETLALAKFAKGSTVISNSVTALEWLIQNK